MESYDLKLPEDYSLNSQKVLAHYAGQLDAQLEQLKKAVDGLTTEQLEWQPGPGMNTIGMLLAHNAIAEAFWVSVAAAGFQPDSRGEDIIRRITGLGGNDDGLPLAKDGGHPDTLKGKSLDNYLKMMDSARKATHRLIKGWTDYDLDSRFVLEEKQEFTYAWALYHVLEHFIGHLGQIRLLKRMMQKE